MVADLIQPGHGTLDHMLLLIGGHDTDGQDNVTVELDIVLVGQVVMESCSVTVLVTNESSTQETRYFPLWNLIIGCRS